MSHGGSRRGAGRKLGGANKASAQARDAAAKTGELPHEFLLRVSRGEVIDGYTPEFRERVDAAKAAAHFYAPRLTTTKVDADVNMPQRALCELTDEELLIIAVGGHVPGVKLNNYQEIK